MKLAIDAANRTICMDNVFGPVLARFELETKRAAYFGQYRHYRLLTGRFVLMPVSVKSAVMFCDSEHDMLENLKAVLIGYGEWE